MKNYFNEFKKGDKQTKLFMVLTLIALLVAAGLVLFLLNKYIGVILSIAAAVFVICFDKIEDYLINKNTRVPTSCDGCLGCSYFYPRIRRTVFTALRQCSNVLPVKAPETEKMIETVTHQPADGLPRCSFKMMKLMNRAEEFNISLVRECLSQTINDAFSSNAKTFAGSNIKSLYIEDLQENKFSYIFTVMPVCPGQTDKYIEKLCKREMLMQDYPEQQETDEGVYDDVF